MLRDFSLAVLVNLSKCYTAYMIEETSYQDSNVAKQYLEFTNSENGKIQQEVIWDVIEKTLQDFMSTFLKVF